jgi:hypothetical protein
MRALSLRQPWPWIIMHLDKRIENRTRNLGEYRGPLLLHSSSKMTSEDWWSAYEFVRERLGETAANSIPKPTGKMQEGHPDLPMGVIFARTSVIGQFDARHAGVLLDYEVPELPEQRSLWYMGSYAYVFGAVERTDLVTCSGALGFWRVPQAIIERACCPEDREP